MKWIFLLIFSCLAQERVKSMLSYDFVDSANQIYFKTYPSLDSAWMKKFALPLAGELGKNFQFSNIPFNINFLGFYKMPFLFQGGDYVLRAQLSFPLLD